MMPSLRQTSILSFLFWSILQSTVVAFQAASASKTRAAATFTTLNLCPGQGNQLKAAYTASICKKEAEAAAASSIIQQQVQDATASISNADPHNHQNPVVSAKRFLSKSYGNLRSTLLHNNQQGWAWKRHQQQQQQQQENEANKQRRRQRKGRSSKNVVEDETLYPIVGFRWVPTSDGSSVALPTIARPACNLSFHEQPNKEEDFGWYSPACKLDLYSEDPCHAPDMTSTSE